MVGLGRRSWWAWGGGNCRLGEEVMVGLGRSWTSVLLHTMHTLRGADETFLPMLSYILKHGNVTVYEWKHGNPPPEVLEKRVERL